MSDKDMQKYGLYSLIVGVFIFIYLAALIYLIYIVIYSFYYHFQNDTLTTMQVFKMFLKKYIIAFVFYAFGSTVLKNSYKTWKSLNEKRQKANADQIKRVNDTDLVEVPSGPPANVTLDPEEAKELAAMCNTHIDVGKEWVNR